MSFCYQLMVGHDEPGHVLILFTSEFLFYSPDEALEAAKEALEESTRANFVAVHDESFDTIVTYEKGDDSPDWREAVRR